MAQRLENTLFKRSEEPDFARFIRERFPYYVSAPSREPELEDEDPNVETLLSIPCKFSQQAQRIQHRMGLNRYIYPLKHRMNDLFEATQN